RMVKKDYAAALAQIDTALLREPNNADLLTTASGMNALLSRWDAAVENSKRAYSLDPRNPSTVSNVARILRAVRRFKDADDYYAKAMALS
ncbi:hypothetical protein, partial [Salmonella sp. SAL4434]|uniref:hypothetical protein n=1 Tax=Salmonella sp. SAL4434 TaxID=3159889 RepID=UPI0039789FF2